LASSNRESDISMVVFIWVDVSLYMAVRQACCVPCPKVTRSIAQRYSGEEFGSVATRRANLLGSFPSGGLFGYRRDHGYYERVAAHSSPLNSTSNHDTTCSRPSSGRNLSRSSSVIFAAYSYTDFPITFYFVSLAHYCRSQIETFIQCRERASARR
jgi:hypothetical protein